MDGSRAGSRRAPRVLEASAGRERTGPDRLCARAIRDARRTRESRGTHAGAGNADRHVLRRAIAARTRSALANPRCPLHRCRCGESRVRRLRLGHTAGVPGVFERALADVRSCGFGFNRTEPRTPEGSASGRTGFTFLWVRLQPNNWRRHNLSTSNAPR